MTPEKHENFAENLRNLRAMFGLSMSEFSKELDIPKSTLQTVLATGQTTLNTAIRISESLGIPLDVLTDRSMTSNQFKMLERLLYQFDWYLKLSESQQRDVCFYISALIKLVQETSYE